MRIIRAALIGVALLASSTGARAQAVREPGLAPYEIRDGVAIPQSLTGLRGDAGRGRRVAVDRQLGNCLTCHQMPIAEEADHGDVGTDLRGAGSRWSEGELRLRIVNPKQLNPATIMPAFYRVDGLHRVARNVAGKPILTAEQVEDLVAYLMTLTD